MKLNYKKTFLIGLGLFSAQLLWVIYNNYVPIFLQAGAPEFDAQLAAKTYGFGLSATLTGLIMTLDNIAAFLIQPLMGPVSDRTYTRFGRRMPYILVLTPIAVAAFVLIPMAPQWIPAELNGQLESLRGLFTFFVICLVVMLVAMALYRTPLLALMPDLVPSALRSQANGVINLMAGIGGIFAFLVGGILYNLYQPLPFWVGGALTLIAVLILFLTIKEPPELLEKPEHDEGLSVLRDLRRIPKESIPSLVLIIAAIFFYMLGFNSVETFFSSYCVSTLGVSEGTASLIFSAAYISFIVFAIPSGMLAGRIGRKRTMMLGLVIFSVLLLVAYFTPVVPVIVDIMAFGGLAWALININGLPMVVDLSNSDRMMGTFTGLYFIATTLAAVLGPILNGWVIDATGRNYSMIFIVCPAFFVLSMLVLIPLKGGEAKSA